MNIFFIIILILLFIFAYRAINSYKIMQIKPAYLFEKAKTEYFDQPRPHSKSYLGFLQLASSIHSSQQKRLALTLSQLIKDYLALKGQTGSLLCSENLSFLINDPNGWYRHQSALIARSGASRKKDLPEIFYKHFNQILNEVQQLFDIPLVPEKE